MALVFSAFTPHPPLLIPTIGREETKKVEQTMKSYAELEMNLYSTHPDTILVISPHGSYFDDVFTINYCTEYITDLREFGDLSTVVKFSGDEELSYRIRNSTKRKKIPAVMMSEPRLDHGSAIPLFFLTKNLPSVKVMQVGFCGLDYKTHVDFGYLLKEEIFITNKRVAVIASGDLSHALTNNAPAGFNKRGPEFDAKVRELLMSRNLTALLNLEEKFVSDAAECGLRSLLILLGILHNVRYDYKELSYEAPFGVGYLTAQFVL